MRILHLADVHLGASLSAFGPLAAARRAGVLEAFRGVPDLAAREDAHAVVIAGDLFDRPDPGPEILAAARETCRRLVEHGRPVFLVPGNHDALTLRNSPYRELARSGAVTLHEEPRAAGARGAHPPAGAPDEAGPAAHVLGAPAFGEPVRATTPAGTLWVYGVGFDAARCPDPLTGFRRADAPGVHVVVLHASVRDAAHWSPAPGSLALDTPRLAELDADYVALGDHHRFQGPSELGGHPACYPGSFAATDLTEVGDRGPVLVELEPGREPVIRRLPVAVPPVAGLELDVSALADEVAIAEAALQRLGRPAVPVLRLTGEPSFAPDPERVAAELAERFGTARVIDDTRFFASGRLDELARRDTVAGHVVRLGRERMESAPDERDRDTARAALLLALRALEVDA